MMDNTNADARRYRAERGSDMANRLDVLMVDDLTTRAEQAAANLTMCIRALSDGDHWREDILTNALDLVRDHIEQLADDLRDLPIEKGTGIRTGGNVSACDLMDDAEHGRGIADETGADICSNDLHRLRNIMEEKGANGLFAALTTAYYAGVARGCKLAS